MNSIVIGVAGGTGSGKSTFTNSDSPEKYREFVIDYLEQQKKNYDLS